MNNNNNKNTYRCVIFKHTLINRFSHQYNKKTSVKRIKSKIQSKNIVRKTYNIAKSKTFGRLFKIERFKSQREITTLV